MMMEQRKIKKMTKELLAKISRFKWLQQIKLFLKVL